MRRTSKIWPAQREAASGSPRLRTWRRSSRRRRRRRRRAAGRAGTRRTSPRGRARARPIISVSGTSSSSSSCTCSTSRARRPSARSRSWMRIIATLMMSAFEPCMTKLTASRSPSDARLPVRRAELGDGPAPAEQARDVAVARRLLDRPLDERLHVREAREVRVDVLLRLLARDLEVLGEPERRDPVDDPEVDHLRDVALVLRQRRRLLAEHLGRGRRVDVVAAQERLAQLRLAGDVREDAQLDLRVVGREQPRAPARRRTPSGSRARARCGSGSPAGSGSTSRAARSRRPSG